MAIEMGGDSSSTSIEAITSAVFDDTLISIGWSSPVQS